MKTLYLAYDQVVGIEAAEPGDIVITGRGNRYHDAFQQATAKGAIVLAYWNPFEIPVGSQNPQDLEQWMGDTTIVPRWRFAGGPVRSNFPGTELADITPNSSYRKHFIAASDQLIAGGKFGGFFCDTLGAKPWKAGYDQWPMAEQQAWTEYAVDLARELHETRMRVNPKLRIVHNNFWQLAASHPAAAIAKTGTNYSDGGVVENTPTLKVDGVDTGRIQPYHINYASRTFGGPNERIMLAITGGPAYAVRWAMVPGITHIALVDKSRGQSYLKPTPALYEQIAALQTTVADPAQQEQLAAALAQLAEAQASAAALQAAHESARTSLLSTSAELQRAHATIESARSATRTLLDFAQEQAT